MTRKIEEIQNVISFKKSALAGKTFNEVNGRNKSNKAKLKATSEKESIHLCHDQFNELLDKPTLIQKYNESIEQANDQLDIKTGLFTAYELRKAIKAFNMEKQ